MKTLALLAAACALTAAPAVFAADVDLNNLPEPTKALCQDADFMMSLSQKLQGETDPDTLQKASQFIQKCQTVMMQ